MAVAYKVLGQQAPAANTQTTIYTVPGSTSALCSTLVVAELSGAATTFCIRIKVAGAADADKQMIAKNVVIGANEMLTITIGWTLATTDVVQVSSVGGTVAFTLFGQEVT